ncbi:MAG: hypothetical protein ACJA0W_004308, partial [Candidatus Azotimanducaceae bacterium]
VAAEGGGPAPLELLVWFGQNFLTIVGIED